VSDIYQNQTFFEFINFGIRYAGSERFKKGNSKSFFWKNA